MKVTWLTGSGPGHGYPMTTLARRLKGADTMNTTFEALTRESGSLRCGRPMISRHSRKDRL
jgi:hypothetical protein